MRITINEGYEVVEFSGEFQVIDVSRITNENASFDCTATLNETGLALWNLLEQGKSFDELVAFLSERDDLEEEEAWQDTTEFLAKMRNAGAIELDRNYIE
ncbi:MAG TPA: PqqD family protein [Lachnospiraceae bacterium]|nr:PqqD family protein [Lachnospiraceae bacterium]